MICILDYEKIEDINLHKLILYKNISLVFITKSFKLFNLIMKYINELSKYFDEISYTNNKYIKDLYCIIELFIKKIFICLNFNKYKIYKIYVL